ncbi:Uncharacterised protein [uncultured archaeon]|nr:Uncharacterised protein [uncultured archaeon]
MRFYLEILTRNRFLKNILTSIHPNQKIGAQIRLFFELQAAYIVECMDLFIDEIIHEQGLLVLRGTQHGLRGVLVHVCQRTGISVHAIDWRDSRRGYARITSQ